MMSQTILVVEDNKLIRQLVRKYLEKNGYTVVEAGDGEEARHIFLEHHPCLVILDLILPKVSGEAFLRWLTEEEDADVSIIIVSAKSKVSDKIAGLNMGADSYLTKPFDPEELVAHVEAVLRRTGHLCQKITYDGLTIKPKKGEVLLFDQPVTLTSHEFKLLYFFMQHPNLVFSREELVNQIYPHGEQEVLDRTIDAHIKKLREKIEVQSSKPTRIKTVRGMGYKFVVS